MWPCQLSVGPRNKICSHFAVDVDVSVKSNEFTDDKMVQVVSKTESDWQCLANEIYFAPTRYVSIRSLFQILVKAVFSTNFFLLIVARKKEKAVFAK
jgi:hypothetical protein